MHVSLPAVEPTLDPAADTPRESSPLLADIALFNPFTHAIETIRFAFAGQINWESLIVSASVLVVFITLAIIGYNPARGTLSRKAGGPA